MEESNQIVQITRREKLLKKRFVCKSYLIVLSWFSEFEFEIVLCTN